jgi:tetratricopeptide (TPR) repeat protein
MKTAIKSLFTGWVMTSLLYISVYSQTTGAAEGYIRNAKTAEAISQAKVTLISARSEALKFDVFSDKKGHFYKGGLVPGIYKITVEKEGFFPMSDSIRVGLGGTAGVEIKLESIESAIPESSRIADQGMKLLDGGKYEEAVQKFTDAIAADKTNPVFYYYRGVSLEKGGNVEGALEDYRKASELKPDFVLPISRTGNVYAKNKDFSKAIEFYKKAMEAGERDTTIWYNYGVCLLNLRENESARTVFEKLLSQDPNYADAYYHLGIIHLNLGDPAKAKELLQKFLEMDPENRNAATAGEILKSLK